MAQLQDPRPCLEVIRELDLIAQEVLGSDRRYFVLGGIATAAINNADSIFDHQTQRVIAAPDSSEPTIRDNGTKRDLDLLVFDTIPKEEAVTTSKEIAEAIDDQMEVSVFGLEPHRDFQPFGRLILTASSWISKRTVDENSDLRIELFPLEQILPQSTFSPWTLQLPSGEGVSILNPATHMLAYRTRSISGRRYKDEEKLRTMEDRVLADTTFKAMVQDGDLSALREFAEDLEALATANTETVIAIAKRRGVAQVDIQIAQRKSRILRALESKQTIIKYAQRGFGQNLTKLFTKST